MTTPSLLEIAERPDPAPVSRKRTRTKKTRTEEVADFMRARAGQWIDGLDIGRVGGAYAWRTRLSECRQFYGMVIENRMVPSTPPGRFRSEYRYVPSSERQE